MSQSRREQTKGILRRGNNSISLQTRLVSFVLLVSLVPLIIISARDIRQTQQALTDAAEISLKSSAAQTANNLDNFIQTTLDLISVEAQFNDFISYLTLSPSSPPLVQARALDLLNKLRTKANIISYALVDTSGTVLLDTLAINVNNNESEEPYFLPAQFSDKPVVSYVVYEQDKTTSITFAGAIRNINGAFIGILRVKYKAAVLQDIAVKSVGTSTDTSILLLDQLSIRLADSQHPELILKSVTPLKPTDYSIAVNNHRLLDTSAEEQATNYPDFEVALDNAVNQPFFRADINPDIAGDDTIAVAFLQTQPWLVAYSRPTSIFLADVQEQIRTNIILVFSTLVIISMITALIARSLTNPITALAKVADSISQGDLNARAIVSTTDEIGVLASAFNSMTDQLQSILVGLEQRIQERTADLQKNTLELETIADVAREISIIRDMDTLLNVTVELIRERFKYYHVGIYLVDERGDYAVLRAASSVAAEQLLAENYKLRVGQSGLIGNVTRTGQAYIALDPGTDAAGFGNPLLPETRSEIVLPLRSHNITIGALDIQANTPAAFDESDVRTFQIFADQVAAAIENAQLAQRIEENLAALTIANRLQSQQIWRSVIDERERPAYEYDGLQVRAVPQDIGADLLKQLETGKPVVVKQSANHEGRKPKNTLMIPLMVLNQVIGVIGLEQEDPNRIWTDEEIAIAQAAANRAALTLENSRLLEESQRRASREQAISQISAKIGAGTEIESILKTAIRELGTQIGGAQITVEIGNGDK